MEKKTMGGFIAALRRAGGMTQRDLADRLNVSDKTVSRWERDDGAPDLSLIPVIAEIFGVTCDELLRGQRRSQDEAPPEDAASARGERERKRLLKAALSRYQVRTYISMGLAVGGLLTALVCNFAFFRAVLGFYLGAALFAVSVVCQAVSIRLALGSVDDAGLSETELSDFRRAVYRYGALSNGLTAALLGFTAPLLTASAFTGLSAEFALYGLISAGLSLAVFAAARWLLSARLVKTGVFILSADEERAYRRNHALQARCAAVLACALALTALADHVLTGSDRAFLEGTVFTDYDDFKEFMERDVDYSGRAATGASANPVAPDSNGGEDMTGDSDEFGRYVLRNKSVYRVSYSENTLPITVYTYQDMDRAASRRALANAGFSVLYCLELGSAALYYLLRRSRRPRDSARRP